MERGERGLRGKKGRRWWLGLVVVVVPAGKVPDRLLILTELGNFRRTFMNRQVRSLARVDKILLEAVFRSPESAPKFLLD